MNALALSFGSAVNFATPRDVYPSAPGATTAQIASAQTPYTTDMTSASPANTAADPAPAAVSGSTRGAILTALVVIIALFLALGFVGHKIGGKEGETGLSNLRFSGYNIAYITLASVIGIGFLKIAFTKWNVPGLSTYIGAL